VIEFPNGLPGFPEEKDFIILDMPGNAAFQLLQSITTSELAFVITNPYLFYQDFELKLEKELLEQLEIKEENEVAIYAIVTVQQPFSNSTMNLRAPLVVNTKKFTGKQYIVNDSIYSSRSSLTPEEKGEESC
jgi:flagellar assembly factor FliW